MTIRATYTETAIFAAGTALSIEDLRRWFRDELDNRTRYAILPGTKEYDEIVTACAERKAKLEREIETQTKLKRAI